MRKRKYKAWNKMTETMTRPFTSDDFLLFDPDEEMYFWELLDFTGFTDVNGVELYESDIYTWWFDAAHRAERQGTGKRRVAVVNYSIGNDGDGYHTSGFTLACGWQDSFEKIGNLWENPEMREEVRAQGDHGGG